MCDSKWPTRQALKIVEAKKRTQKPPIQPEREHPALEVSPKSRVLLLPSEDVPATSRTRRMAQEMKKLRNFACAT